MREWKDLRQLGNVLLAIWLIGSLALGLLAVLAPGDAGREAVFRVTLAVLLNFLMVAFGLLLYRLRSRRLRRGREKDMEEWECVLQYPMHGYLLPAAGLMTTALFAAMCLSHYGEALDLYLRHSPTFQSLCPLAIAALSVLALCELGGRCVLCSRRALCILRPFRRAKLLSWRELHSVTLQRRRRAGALSPYRLILRADRQYVIRAAALSDGWDGFEAVLRDAVRQYDIPFYFQNH